MKDFEDFNRRFKLIQAAITGLYGRDVAFAAATGVWLRALQYASTQAMLKVVSEIKPDAEQLNVLHGLVSQLEDELQIGLQGLHAEICQHLNVEVQQALDLGNNFKEVITDITERNKS